MDAVDNPTKVVNDAVNRAKNFGAETAGEIQAVGKAYETAGITLKLLDRTLLVLSKTRFRQE